MNKTHSAGRKDHAHILLAEGDDAARNEVTAYLEGNGMQVVVALGRSETLRLLTAADPCLAIVALAAEREHGLGLLTEIRSSSTLPIIVTGRRSEDLVTALELGADDAILKPFGLRELYARVRNLLRRRIVQQRRQQRLVVRERFQFGGWELNVRHQRLTAPDGSPVELTKAEFTLLVAFLRSPRQPLTRDQLLEATRMHQDVFDRCIDTQIFRLRRKLECDPQKPKMIRTSRGIGYVFELEVRRSG
ncbi:winged helix-turn-helix domain-containing protein [Dongia sedimenti]|uniref:Winged helix-turn-helix domain-containing protein n=1 Tax=Dongia sedimenti TaxID=3064282 RepID=A0ABU0YS08_9PROT|nr:winged helix-turn-helix domain-containing protein [Rhodospirillaceae bacterium R-7]